MILSRNFEISMILRTGTKNTENSVFTDNSDTVISVITNINTNDSVIINTNDSVIINTNTSATSGTSVTTATA